MSYPYCTTKDPNKCPKHPGSNDQCWSGGPKCASNAYCREWIWFQPKVCRPKPSVRGIVTGKYCESNAQCASGLCEDYLCKAKANACDIKDPNKCNGGQKQCDSDSHCVSNAYCRKVVGQPNVCRQRSSVRGIVTGKYCEYNAQCASGLCEDYLCKAKANACDKKDPNKCNGGQKQCDSDSQCVSNAYCKKVVGQPNMCRPKSSVRRIVTGKYCESHVQCASGLCIDYLCKAKAKACDKIKSEDCDGGQKQCDSDSECEANAYCRKVAGQPNACRNRRNMTGIVTGKYCESNAQCASGLCIDYGCKIKTPYCSIKDPRKCNKGKSQCNVKNDCTPNAYCRKVAGQPNACRPESTVRGIATGQYCESDAQCGTGLCRDYLCKDKAPYCKVKDPWKCNNGKKQCEGDVDCEANAYCRKVAGQPNACRPKQEVRNITLEKYCENDKQCASGLCNDYLCSEKSEACTVQDPRACNNGEKQCERDIDCEANAYCRKVAGQPNVCRYKDSVKDRPMGDACTSADQCVDGYCDAYACSDTPPSCSFLNPGACIQAYVRYMKIMAVLGIIAGIIYLALKLGLL